MAKPLTPPPNFKEALASPTNPIVRDLVDRFRPPSAPESDQGVVNWMDYDERMHFIVGYFMMYQNVPAMFAPPFGDEPVHGPIWRALHGVLTALRQIVRIPGIIDPSLDDIDRVPVRLGPMTVSDREEGTDDDGDDSVALASAS